ncbi:MAG TPA: uroporphyrinogen-III synthase [Candidatus Sumerlaeota bacterium]|nr:uroporphyrinogen-III synthase [Candidatus Sumerlaeota bacterium]
MTASNAQAVLESLLPHVRGENVHLVGGAEQGDSLLESLAREGVTGTRLPVFRYIERPVAPVDWRHVDEVFFAGPVAMEAFPQSFPEANIHNLAACCMGETLANRARAMGFVRVRNIAALADRPRDGENICETVRRHGPNEKFSAPLN